MTFAAPPMGGLRADRVQSWSPPRLSKKVIQGMKGNQRGVFRTASDHFAQMAHSRGMVRGKSLGLYNSVDVGGI